MEFDPNEVYRAPNASKRVMMYSRVQSDDQLPITAVITFGLNGDRAGSRV